MARGGRKHHELPELLQPQPGDLGLITSGVADLRDRTIRAWDLFAELADQVDLHAATRSDGNTAKDLLVSVGAWPDARGLVHIVADAEAGRTDVETQSDADRRLRAAHRHESDAAVVAAVHTAAEHLREWYSSPQAAAQARMVTASPLGPVPVATYLYAAAFHLAVTARDLIPAGAVPLPELDRLGLVALVDSSGAVAARLGATASIAALTPESSVGTGAHDHAWRTTIPSEGHKGLGPAVQGPAGLIIDVAGGRVDFLEVARSLRLKHPRRLMEMSVVLDGIPDLPAAAMLRRASALARALPF